jgi:serine peptidase DegS
MSPLWKVAAFFAQSAAVGLAIAFLVVLFRPDLVSSVRPAASRAVTSYADAVAVSAPAVATIYTERTLTPSNAPPGIALRGHYLGSGVVIDRRGYVVTNWHVIRDMEEIRVQLADGRVATPQIVGSDPETELALLRIDLPDLPTISLGRSDGLQVGEVVLAIGNSLGLSQTVTMGIVSATGRGQLGITAFEDFIQTDAAINVGNSGGALVNSRGELVGINTATISAAPRDLAMPEGIGFAIPVNLVRGVMQQLVANGRVIRGYLGVIEPSDLPELQARRLGLDGSAVLLDDVVGPAAAAGLRRGDILTHINDQRMFTGKQAMNLVASSQPGTRIKIRVARPNGAGLSTFSTEAVLEERPPQDGG